MTLLDELLVTQSHQKYIGSQNKYVGKYIDTVTKPIFTGNIHENLIELLGNDLGELCNKTIRYDVTYPSNKVIFKNFRLTFLPIHNIEKIILDITDESGLGGQTIERIDKTILLNYANVFNLNTGVYLMSKNIPVELCDKISKYIILPNTLCFKMGEIGIPKLKYFLPKIFIKFNEPPNQIPELIYDIYESECNLYESYGKLDILIYQWQKYNYRHPIVYLVGLSEKPIETIYLIILDKYGFIINAHNIIKSDNHFLNVYYFPKGIDFSRVNKVSIRNTFIDMWVYNKQVLRIRDGMAGIMYG